MPVIPYMAAIIWLASVSNLPTFTLPTYFVANSSTTGAIIRQGKHHSAQKSTSTGIFDLSLLAQNLCQLMLLHDSLLLILL